MPTALATVLALLAFAANSILCRMALGGEFIDPVSFTTLRLLSGAAALGIMARILRGRTRPLRSRNWISALMLFGYAVAFSLAYVSLAAGTGALILFGSVQITMIVTALFRGERPRSPEWAGLLIASAGLVYLVFPGLTSPSPVGSLLMGISGAAWGVYSLRGRGSVNPILETASNFSLAVWPAAAASLISLTSLHLKAPGILLAALSGSVTSGVGYVIWYAALKGLTATRAATVQLSVPVLAAAGGVLFLGETLSLRLLLSSILILGGIAMAALGRGRRT